MVISYSIAEKRQKVHKIKLTCDFIPLHEADIFLFLQRWQNLLKHDWEVEHVGQIVNADDELVTLVAVLKRDCIEVVDHQGEQSLPLWVRDCLVGGENDEDS